MAAFLCRVTPNARKTEVLGLDADEHGVPLLKLKLNAPPVDGKANLALVAYFSEALGVAKGRVEIVKGEKGRLKRIEVGDLEADELAAKLRGLLT